MTIDVTAMRQHIESDLDDDAIERLLDDAYAFCIERAGTSGEQTAVLRSGERYLVLPYSVESGADIEISERSGDQTTALVMDTDWRWVGGRLVERLASGSLVYWGYAYGAGDVLVTFTPRDDEARRDRVVVDLVKLAIQYNALGSERAGDYTAHGVDYAQERDRIVRQLVTTGAIA